MKEWIKKNRFLVSLMMLFFRIIGYNRFKIKGRNTIKIDGILKRGRIYIKGKNNKVIVKNPKCNIGFNVFIQGNNNTVIIEDNCILKGLHLWIEDDNNEIVIKKKTMICGETKLCCLEGSRIHIGESCMFSDHIHFRTSDSHSILDENGKRINQPDDIVIHDHVWIGYHVTVLKGAEINNNTIVGANAVVTKKIEDTECAVAGNPARVVKKGINWHYKRIEVGAFIGEYNFED